MVACVLCECKRQVLLIMMMCHGMVWRSSVTIFPKCKMNTLNLYKYGMCSLGHLAGLSIKSKTLKPPFDLRINTLRAINYGNYKSSTEDWIVSPLLYQKKEYVASTPQSHIIIKEFIKAIISQPSFGARQDLRSDKVIEQMI